MNFASPLKLMLPGLLGYTCTWYFYKTSAGDAYPGITADSGTFTIQFYGGSNWKGTGAFTFGYSKQEKNWFLTRQITESYFMDKRQYSSDTLTGKQLGKVPICKFSIYENI